jgi:hypothetical protein
MTRLAMIASVILAAPSAMAQAADHSEHEQHQQPTAPTAQQPPAEHDHSQMDHSQMNHMAMDHSGGHDMSGALGAYPMPREGLGTSWVPDASEHGGIHAMSGGWTFMTHANLDVVYSSQDGPRGDDKAFLAGMLMATARRDFGANDTLQLRGMLSPDPTMGNEGYPLLLAAGETADGVNTLVDRQHPHDLFMELSASWSHRFSDTDSVFVYGGLPGEPAFGPPAFMHRPAAMASPEAPVTHHWIDSTHITFGVVTAGWVHGDFKVEASKFRGREPDQDRYDIETGDLDSTSVRVSWNPTQNWALQASWANVKSPEQLEPDVDVNKFSASALYTQKLANGGELALTGAFARKDNSEDVTLEAWLAEGSWKLNDRWTIFSRA